MTVLFLGFFVFGVVLAPLAKLLHHQPVGNEFLVLAGIIVYAVANGAFQRNHLVLTHVSVSLINCL